MGKYKIHTIVFLVLIALSSFSIIIGYINGLLQKEQQLTFLKKLPYEYCYQFSGNDYMENTFVDLNSSYSLRTDHELIKCDKLMQLEVNYTNDDVWGSLPVLRKNEIIMSSNLLTLYDIKVGDEVTVQSQNSATPTTYFISGAIPPCYGLYDRFVDHNKGVVVFGADDSFLLNNTTSFLVFQNSDYKASDTAAELIGLFSLQKQYHAILKDFLQVVFLIWFIQFTTDIISVCFLYYRYNRYLKKLYRSGMSRWKTVNKLFCIILTPALICHGFILLSGIMFLFTMGEYTILLISFLELLLLFFINGIQEKLI